MGTFKLREPLILQNVQKPPPGQEISEHQVVGCQKSNSGKYMPTLFLYLVSRWTSQKQDIRLHSQNSLSYVLLLAQDLLHPSCKQHPLLPSVHTQTHNPSLQQTPFGLSVCPTSSHQYHPSPKPLTSVSCQSLRPPFPILTPYSASSIISITQRLQGLWH